MKRIALAAAFVLAVPALAQQQPPSPVEQALSQRVMNEVGANIQANAKIVELTQQIADKDKRIKALEDERAAAKPKP